MTLGDEDESCVLQISVSWVRYLTEFKLSLLGPQGPLVLLLIDPPVCAKNLDHLYKGIHALWIIRSLIKPTQCNGLVGSHRCPLDPWDPVGIGAVHK